MTIPTLTQTSIDKIKLLIDEGCSVKTDIAALNDGLKETVAAISEELDIPAKILNRAINTVYKSNFGDLENDWSDLDMLLETVKRKT